ncbi:hypothetical protein PCASD_00833 [Puccinia coronata f. sp. avenae]|uniref:Uncharacterized protein n=1 Tax=Puccinia coronata f. sp. avenae TaxID=200324 RepID=A0A2N5VPQ9_9BASI|nr:hypothetical protein PCASD_00833 [Puccinia coronata f. sp. avenae]
MPPLLLTYQKGWVPLGTSSVARFPCPAIPGVPNSLGYPKKLSRDPYPPGRSRVYPAGAGMGSSANDDAIIELYYSILSASPPHEFKLHGPNEAKIQLLGLERLQGKHIRLPCTLGETILL